MRTRMGAGNHIDTAPQALVAQLNQQLGQCSSAIFSAATPDDVVAILERLIVTIPVSPTEDKVGRWKSMMSLYRSACAAAAGGVSIGDIQPLARLVLDEARGALHRRYRTHDRSRFSSH